MNFFHSLPFSVDIFATHQPAAIKLWSAPFLIELIPFFDLSKTFSSPGAFVVAFFVRAAAPLSKRVHTMTASHDHDRDMTTWWNSAVFWRKVLVMQRPGSQRRRVVWRHCWCPPGRVPFTEPLRAVFVWCNVRKFSWTSVNFEKVESFVHNIALLRFVSYGPNLWYLYNSLCPFFTVHVTKKDPIAGSTNDRQRGDGGSSVDKAKEMEPRVLSAFVHTETRSEVGN